LGIHAIPSDKQIRALREPVRPELVVPVCQHGLATLAHPHQLAALRSWQNRLLVVLDGPQSFSSPQISGPQCATQKPATGTTTYSHRLLPPVLVAPGQDKGLPLPPAFIVPQDGHDQQDCENAAANRWRRNYARHYRVQGIPIWGEERDAHPPLGAVLLEEGVPFLLVGKPASPPSRSPQLEHRELGKARHPVTHRHPTTKGLQISTYRSAPQLPLRAPADAVPVKLG
jgi:hypothetical protein